MECLEAVGRGWLLCSARPPATPWCEGVPRNRRWQGLDGPCGGLAHAAAAPCRPGDMASSPVTLRFVPDNCNYLQLSWHFKRDQPGRRGLRSGSVIQSFFVWSPVPSAPNPSEAALSTVSRHLHLSLKDHAT